MQEHRLVSANDIAEASAHMAIAGFASVWGKAEHGPKGSPAAGVAIFVSMKLGCKPVCMQAPESRAIATKVQLPGEQEFLMVSAYLHSGRGLKLPNLELIGAIASLQEEY